MSGAVVWLTGLSGAGKTTIAKALRDRLTSEGRAVVVLDGDELRRALSRDLGFTKEDRDEHVRRVAQVALDEARHGTVAIAALISPYREARDRARNAISPEACFVEVHLDCPLDVLRARDPKGLYRKADAGEVARFTGVSDPYEPPLRPEARIDTSRLSVDEAIAQVRAAIERTCRDLPR